MANRQQMRGKHSARRPSGTPQTWNAYPTGDMRGPRHASTVRSRFPRWVSVFTGAFFAIAAAYGLVITIVSFMA